MNELRNTHTISVFIAGIAFSLSSCGPQKNAAQSQSKSVPPQTYTERISPFENTFEYFSKAQIHCEAIAENNETKNTSTCESSAAAFYNVNSKTETTISYSTCSGFIAGSVEGDLLYMTNRHCLTKSQLEENSTSCTDSVVALTDGRKLKCKSLYWKSDLKKQDRDVAIFRLDGGAEQKKPIPVKLNYDYCEGESLKVLGFDFSKGINEASKFVSQDCTLGTSFNNANESLRGLENCSHGIKRGFSGSVVVGNYQHAIGILNLATWLDEEADKKNELTKLGWFNNFSCLDTFNIEEPLIRWSLRNTCKLD